jgi:hypothetical protein
MNKNHKPFFISHYSRASFLPALGLQVINIDQKWKGIEVTFLETWESEHRNFGLL